MGVEHYVVRSGTLAYELARELGLDPALAERAAEIVEGSDWLARRLRCERSEAFEDGEGRGLTVGRRVGFADGRVEGARLARAELLRSLGEWAEQVTANAARSDASEADLDASEVAA